MDFSGNVFLRYGFGFKLFVFNYFATSLLILFLGPFLVKNTVYLFSAFFLFLLLIDVEKVWLYIISWRKKND